MEISVSRKTHFNAAHRLNVDSWSDEKNKLYFGPCNNKNYHGHNYDLIVTLTGEIDKETGYLLKYDADLNITTAITYNSNVVNNDVVMIHDYVNIGDFNYVMLSADVSYLQKFNNDYN